MRKLISICAACSLLLSLFGALPVSAGSDALADDMEAYAQFTDHAAFMSALKAKWPAALEKEPAGKIEAVTLPDRMGDDTTAIHFHSNKNDPYLQTGANMDMDGGRMISFDVKIESLDADFNVCYRDGNTNPTEWFNIFQKNGADGKVTSFGTEIMDQGSAYHIVPGVWHRVAIVTAFDGTAMEMTYSVYIDGRKLVDQAVHAKANARYKNVAVRFAVSSSKEADGYFDNIKIVPLSKAGFQDMTASPANGSTTVETSQNTVRFRFGTEIDPDTFQTGEIAVMESTGGSETAITPAEAVLSGDMLKLRLRDGALPNSADYTVTLPEGIRDINGNPLPEEKRVLMFGTVSDPNNQPPAVSITSPADRTRLDPGSTAKLRIEASDPDGRIVNAIYYANGIEIGRSGQAPFSLDWTVLEAGTYSLTCRVYDDGGARTNSETVTLLVAENQLPTVKLTAPERGFETAPGQPVTLAAAAEDPNGEAVRLVEFFADYQKIGEAAQAPYTCVWIPEAEGDYALSARAYDAAGGGGYAEPVHVTVVRREANVLYEWDMESYDGTNASCPAGSDCVVNENIGGFSKAQLDAAHGLSLGCSIPGVVGNNAPFFRIELAEQKTGMLTAEAELRLDTTEHIVECFTARGTSASGGTAWNTDLIFKNGEIRTQGPDAKVMDFEANRWYKLKAVYNLDAKTVEIYIDGTLVSSKAYQNTGMAGIPQIRFTHKSEKETAGTMYLDNVRISVLPLPIKAEGIAAKNAAGETLSEYHAADISAIEVAFSKALAPGTVNAESVKLYKGYEDVSLAAEVSCGNDNKAVVVKPAGPLEDASLYRVVLSDAVKDSEGNSIGRNRGGSVRTLAGDYGIQNGVFESGGEPLHAVMTLAPGDTAEFRAEAVNAAGGQKDVWVMTALYRGNTMEKYQLTRAVVSGGEPQEISGGSFRIDGALTPEHSLRGFVWDSETGAALGEQFILQ